jgi:hypothetical protein
VPRLAKLPPKRAASESNVFGFVNRLADKSLMAEGHKTARSKDVDTVSNVGPANYNIERVIGRKNIVQSHIASVPQVSFG